MTARAAVVATQAADALLEWLDSQTARRPASSSAAPAETGLSGEAAESGSMEPGSEPAVVAAADQIGASREPRTGASAVEPPAPMRLPTPDWLHHRLTISGPPVDVRRFRQAAAGAGIIPWQLDLDRMEEDYFHLLVAPEHRSLGVAGARIFARQLRDAVGRRHEIAVSRVGHSRACPFDLHALIPVPSEILLLGPNDPAALTWLWEHWGTTDALRHVAEDNVRRPVDAGAGVGAETSFRLRFWSADWTPWRALAELASRWPTLRWHIRPTYDPP